MPDYTILLIDYEPKSIDKVRRPLTDIGYRVEVATDGVTGVEAFHRLKPDLVMIEAMIPKKHGFEVCQDLKKTPHGKRTPIIIMTSVYKGRKYRTQAFHLHGCDEYIEKPVSEEQVVEICRKLLGDTAASAGLEPLAAPSDTVEMSHGDRPPAMWHSGPTPVDTGAVRTVSNAPSAASGVEDDELEIMARLDAILPAATSSRPEPPQQSAKAIAEPSTTEITTGHGFTSPSRVEQDPFATTFLSSADSAHVADLPPLRKEPGAEDLPQMHELEGPVPTETSLGRTAPEQDEKQVVSFQSRQSKKKERRKKGTETATRTGPSDGATASAVATALEEPEVAPFAPAAAAAVEREPQTGTAVSAPESALDWIEPHVVEDAPRRRLWVSVAVALALVGAAGALLYLYASNLLR